MLKPAFGMIVFLLGTLIVAIMLALMIPALKKTSGSTSGGVFGPSPVKTESVEDKTNEMLDEIQNMRNQSIEYNKEVQKEGY